MDALLLVHEKAVELLKQAYECEAATGLTMTAQEALDALLAFMDELMEQHPA